jgi:Conjugative transposon protein TcpC
MHVTEREKKGEPRRGRTRANVSMSVRPLWRLKLAREVPRYALCALSVAGVVASARFAIAPPRPAALPLSLRKPLLPDRGAEGYASLFARRYLTWSAIEPQASQRALAAFTGPGIEPDAGLQLPSRGEQRVEWIDLVQQREPTAGTHVYTLAVQTDTAGLIYLTVSVARLRDGSLALAGYPAFVGAPASSPAISPARLREVGDPALNTVIQRALRNYLDASADELAADLTGGARIALPASALTLESVRHLNWAPGGGSVLALVQAQDERGVQYTLSYELDVASRDGRWEISAIQTDPDA